MTNTKWNIGVELLDGRRPVDVAAELLTRVLIATIGYGIALGLVDWVGVNVAVALFVGVALGTKSKVRYRTE